MTITIQDDNPRPYFDDPGPIHIQEHTPQPGGLIYQGKAFDRSGEEIVVCDCTFEIDAGNKKGTYIPFNHLFQAFNIVCTIH